MRKPFQKPLTVILTILAAGLILADLAWAQQIPASATQQLSTPSKSSPSAPKKAPAAKPGQASAKKAPAPLLLKTDKDKLSYAIGISVAKGLSQNLKQTGVDIDPAILTRALKDVLAGDKQSMTDEEAQTTLKALQAELVKAQELKAEQLAETNKKESDEFLAANKAKEGIVALPSGLQYKVLEEGTGPKPAAGDMVTVNYRGTFLNGTEFDSSYKHGQPASFPVGGIIKGWNEALQLMPVGSKWELYVPPDLAYGPRGAPPRIGPNSALIFEIELISVQPKTPPASAPAPTPAAAPTASPTSKP
ncbi:MAG TPA: FKBP-type peptidyl-prolyl cis-trans isomerase [Candidatus Acidoferrum sp.]|nr:FKBP-type peptidyl-prolyl cis-trans isomerase [Candidatus Acidoferrum sp.]